MPKEIDLKATRTEPERQRAVDKFALSATRQWFEWLGWVLIFGAFLYLYKETGHPAVQIILSISGALFILHFASFFYQWEFKNLPFIKNVVVARFLSYLLSGLIGMGLYWLLTTVVQLLGENSA